MNVSTIINEDNVNGTQSYKIPDIVLLVIKNAEISDPRNEN